MLPLVLLLNVLEMSLQLFFVVNSVDIGGHCSTSGYWAGVVGCWPEVEGSLVGYVYMSPESAIKAEGFKTLQFCMGSSRMGCQPTFSMTLSIYASRFCRAQNSPLLHVTAQWCRMRCAQPW